MVDLLGAVGPVETVFEDSIGEPFAETAAAITIFTIALFGIWIVGRLVLSPLLGRAMDARGLEAHAKRPLSKLFNLMIFFAAIAVAFGMAGFGSFLRALATIGAAATLAIGFALQDVIKNFAAGIFIFVDKPFRIGDWIEFDDRSGVVEDISLRVTRIRTFDNELLTVPNGQLMNDVIKNPVAKDQLRLKFLFGIGYDDDIDEATEIILDEAEKHDGILDEPEPSVRLVELGDSSVGLQSRIWIANPSRSDFVKIRGEYVQAVKQKFDDAGIEIPYPNRTLSGDLAIGSTEGVLQDRE